MGSIHAILFTATRSASRCHEPLVSDNYNASLTYTPDLVASVAQRCTEVDTGARNVDHILSRTLLPELAGEFLAHMAEGHAITEVNVGVNKDGQFQYELSADK